MTHTKTYNVLNPWAQTFPWDCLVRETGCVSETHDHTPMVGDECNALWCDERLLENETCYATIEVTIRKDGRDRPAWVCWRHVRPDDGPIRVR